MLELRSIEDMNLQGKKVIIRVDYNVPVKNGVITDDNRIVKSLDTINYAIKAGASEIILMSHFEADKKDISKNDLSIVIPVLEHYLNTKVDFIKSTSGTSLVNELNESTTLVKLMQDTRHEKGEKKNDPVLGMHWATLGDVAIFDGFGVSHRNHASTSSMFRHIECAAGILLNNEVNKIEGFLNDGIHPFTIIMGGAKVKDKIPVINNLIDKCDKLVIGGAMAFTFLKAKNIEVGASLVDTESLDFCKNLLNNYSDKIVLPCDFVTNKRIDTTTIEEDEIGFDIGSKTIEQFREVIPTNGKILINGTMGKNEEEAYEKGTKELFNHLSNLADNGVKILVGGGDTASAASKYELKDKAYHVSTGGGATLKYLGNELGDIFTILKKNVKENAYTRNKKIIN